MSELKRPRQVVVVDADNPMEEIHGEFFWRADHERIVAAAREAAYREGYDRGFAAGASRTGTAEVRLHLVRRPRLIARAFVSLVVLAFLASLIGDLLH